MSQNFSPIRKLRAIRPARREDVAHLITRQALSPTPGEMIDPFLLLAHHGPQQFPLNNSGLPFGPHPHRGFETVTFILAGDLLHRDSAGHESVIGPGGVQWMTAGSGVVHSETSSERFLASGGLLEILQLWVNLPGRLKTSPPLYIGVDEPQIPRIPFPGGEVRLVSGSFEGVEGAVESLTGVFLSTVLIDGLLPADLPAPAGRSVLFYVVSGEVVVDDTTIGTGSLAMFESEGDVIRARSSGGAVILFGHADPIKEPIVARGPFIMNTKAEIDAAFSDFRAGRFGAV